MQQVIRSTTICLYVLLCFPIYAQHTPYLEKTVNIDVINVLLGDVFRSIEKQTGVVFSYNPKLVNDQKKVSLQVLKSPLRLVLEKLSKTAGFTYKVRNNYIILAAGEKKATDAPSLSLSGYVYNRHDGSVLPNASIYLTSGKYAAVSDNYGYFTITSPKTKDGVKLAVARENFKDSVFVLQQTPLESVKIFLTPNPPPEPTVPTRTITQIEHDTLRHLATADTTFYTEKKLRWLPNFSKMKFNLRNIKDTFLSGFSFSLVPPISTNKLLSFNTVNKVSLNALVGYSKGVRYAEVGGLINVDHGDVRYAQIGGLGNWVSGSATGAQIGGLYTITGQNVTGLQIGGLLSKTRDTVTGAQVGGLVAGADHIRGLQLGGLYSKNNRIEGLQLSGLFSYSQHVSGTQISGLLNYARTMEGFQLSFINIARDAKGIPLGFFSYVRNGYHKIELSANEMRMVNLGFRTGVDYFHNIVFAGIGIDENNRAWTYGYGLGARFKLGNKWKLNTDITAQQVNPVNGSPAYLNLVNKMLVAAEFCPGKHFSIAIGPSYNIRVADTRSSTYNTVMDTRLIHYMSDQDEGGLSTMNTKTWIGAGISLKFL